MAGKKTDNANLQAKVDLRVMMIEKYHQAKPPSVLDCCEGEGLIWDAVQRRCQLGARVGIDLKYKKGRARTDSSRVIGGLAASFDMIDIDTYGLPWTHWLHALRGITGACSVFLTKYDRIAPGGARLNAFVAEKIGMSSEFLARVPSAFGLALNDYATPVLLAQAYEEGLAISGIWQAAPNKQKADYLAIRLDKQP